MCTRAKDACTDSNYERIIALQALSTFYLPEGTETPGGNYPWVTYRALGRYLNRDASRLEATLLPLAAQGFCEVTPYLARLSPERWAENSSRYSTYLSYYVGNAPCSLRVVDSLVPVDPRICYSPQPNTFQGKSATETSNFNGVYDASKYRALCEQRTGLSPLELLPLYHETSLASLSMADNIAFLVAGCAKFRLFFAALYLQVLQLPTILGVLGMSVAQYVDSNRVVVFALSDCLGLPLLSPSLSQPVVVADFVADLTVPSSTFDCQSAYPLVFTTLHGGTVTLYAGGEAQVVDAAGNALPPFIYALAGVTLNDSYLVVLTSLLPPGTALACGPPHAGESCPRSLVPA